MSGVFLFCFILKVETVYQTMFWSLKEEIDFSQRVKFSPEMNLAHWLYHGNAWLYPFEILLEQYIS